MSISILITGKYAGNVAGSTKIATGSIEPADSWEECNYECLKHATSFGARSYGDYVIIMHASSILYRISSGG